MATKKKINLFLDNFVFTKAHNKTFQSNIGAIKTKTAYFSAAGPTEVGLLPLTFKRNKDYIMVFKYKTIIY